MTIDFYDSRDHPNPTTGQLLRERRQLINLGYRLLGSLTEAEDVVQETYTRWYAMSPQQRATIENPGGWLVTVASRICLDQLGSARARRESYVGEWIPEPLPTNAYRVCGSADGPHVDPADRVTLAESINMAFLVILESMTPAERVTFILHDVFRYTFPEIAQIVGRTPAGCRQLASSARRRIQDAQESVPPPSRAADVVKDFRRAWESKDIAALVRLLDPYVTAVADGGGVIPAARRPISGNVRLARMLVGYAERAPDLEVVERTVNGQPGLVVQVGQATMMVMAFELAGDQIRTIWAVSNPDKLQPWLDRP